MSRDLPARQELIDFLAGSKAVLAAVQTSFPGMDSSALASTLGARVSSQEVSVRASNEQNGLNPGGKVFLHTDGACRGNPGPSGAGWVFSEPGGRIFRRGGAFLGVATNNEAEYVAAILGLEDASKEGFEEIVLHADSELMIKQITGVYRVKNPRIKKLYGKLMTLLNNFKQFEARHVRREFNEEADREANRAIDQAK